MPTGWPGQAGNPVGYAAAPGFSSLTPFSGTLVSGTAGAHQVYSFFDFNAGTGGTAISSLSYVDFVGCRFQSNSQSNYCVNVTGSDHITFTYCSFTPLASLATAPPGAAWPSAGAYPNTPSPLTMTTGVNCLDGNNGYQYGCNVPDGGPVTWSYCDFWGFGQNGPGFLSTTAQMICDNCWIHDACNQSPQSYHTDGLGYQNASTGPSNVTISNCTIASLGNTNGLAFQLASGGYSNIQITGNYISGYGNMIALGVIGGTLFTNSTFANNTIGTDIQWWEFIFYDDYTSSFSGSGNSWHGNKINVVPGSVNWPGGTPYGQGFTSGESAPVFTNANNGQYLWPDNTIHATDFGGGGGPATGTSTMAAGASFSLATPSPGGGTVAVDSIDTVDVASNSATTINLTTLTVGTGSNRALLAILTLQASASAISVHWDSAGTNQAMTLINAVSDTGGVATTYLYGLVAPTSGNKMLTASWTGTSQVDLAAGCFTGVNQTGGTASFVGTTSAGASSASNTVNVSSSTGNYTVGAWEGFVNFATVSATQWYIDNNDTTISSAASYHVGASPSVAFSETSSGTARAWGFVGANIIASAPGSSAATMVATTTLKSTPIIPSAAAMAATGGFNAAPKIPARGAATLAANATLTANQTTGYPGQASNPVGYAAAPGYAGLTVFSGSLTSGTAGAHKVYQYLDFQNGTTPLTINNLSYVDFIGCRFQSNAVSAWPAAESSSNVIVQGTSNNITFQYCSFTPLTSIATTTPGAAWPCAGTGTNTNNQIPGTNSLSETQGYTYGLLITGLSGPLTADHCDFWGFGNIAVFFSNTTPQITISDCWMHDMLAEGPLYQQHQDVIGFLLDQAAGVQNVTISHCTIASMGSDNAVAFQGNTDVLTSYANIIVIGCYITGCGYTITLPGGVERFNPGVTTISGTLIFSNNIVSTEIPWIFGPLYAYYQTNFTPATWYNNTIKVLPGGTPLASSSGDFPDWNYTYANNGNYLWPDSTFATSDWPGTGGAANASATMSAGAGFSAVGHWPPTIVTATLPALATFSATPLAPVITTSAALPASATLASTPSVLVTPSAALKAAGAFTSFAGSNAIVAATMPIVGALSATGQPQSNTSVAVTIQSSLSVSGQSTMGPGAAVLAALGTFINTATTATVFFGWDTGPGWDQGIWELPVMMGASSGLSLLGQLPFNTAAATLAAGSALTSSGALPAVEATMAFSGGGALSVSGHGAQLLSTMSLSAAAALAVSGDLPSYVARAALAATGAMSATLPATVAASATLAVTGALSVSGDLPSRFVTASPFSATGSFAATLPFQQATAVTMVTIGAFIVTGFPAAQASSAFFASTMFTSLATTANVTAASIAGTATFQASPFPAQEPTAAFSVGSYCVLGTVLFSPVFATMPAAGSFVATSMSAAPGALSLSATGSFVAAPISGVMRSGAFPALGAFALSSGSAVANRSVSFPMLGTFASAGTPAKTAAAVLASSTSLLLLEGFPPTMDAAVFPVLGTFTTTSASVAFKSAALSGTSQFFFQITPAIGNVLFDAEDSFLSAGNLTPADLVNVTFPATSEADFEFLGPPTYDAATFGALTAFTATYGQLLHKRDPFLIVNW